MVDVKSVSKTKKSAKEATHPKYNEMIATAIETLKEKRGSSRVAIIKFITSKYKVSDNSNVVNSRVKLALKKGVASGALTQVKGTGVSGSFKLAKKPVEKPKKAVKSPKKESSKVAKSPKKAKAAKKLKAVKSPKKSTKFKKSKSPKKATKLKPKKTSAGKTAKKVAKPKAKKPAKKINI